MSSRPVSGSTSVQSRPSEPVEASDPPPDGGPVLRGRHLGDGVQGEIAAFKGKTADGSDVEVFSVSAQASLRDGIDAQAAMVKGAHDWEAGLVGNRTSMEAFTAKATLSTKGADGSEGWNIAVGASIVAAEHTATWKGSSATLGFGAGVGFEASHGVRDFDKDGSPEFCGRIGVRFLTVGICIEDLF